MEHQCSAKRCENHCPEGSHGGHRDAGSNFHCHPQQFSLEDVKRRMFVLHMHTNVWGYCPEQSCLEERGGLFSWCLSLLPWSPLPPVSIDLLYNSIFQAAAGVVLIKLSMAPCWLLNKVHFKQEFRGLMIYPRATYPVFFFFFFPGSFSIISICVFGRLFHWSPAWSPNTQGVHSSSPLLGPECSLLSPLIKNPCNCKAWLICSFS